MGKFDQEIEQMKTSAEQRNWESFLQALKAIVTETNQKALLEVLMSYVYIFMNEFIELNPQHKPEYDNVYSTYGDQISTNYLMCVKQIVDQHKGEPGVNNFRKAIATLQSIFEPDIFNQDFVDNFLTVTINVLMTIPHQQWGIDHPDLYRQWSCGTSNEDLLILAKYFATDAEQIKKTKLLMLQFTNDIDVLAQANTTNS